MRLCLASIVGETQRNPTPSVDPGQRSPLLACCLGLLLASCLASPQKPVTYVLATIIRIEQPQGEFFSPRMAGPSRPLTKIYLRLDGGVSATDKITVVSVLGL